MFILIILITSTINTDEQLHYSLYSDSSYKVIKFPLFFKKLYFLLIFLIQEIVHQFLLA